MRKLSYHVIQTARDGVDTLDEVRRERGITQKAISALANTPDVGQQYARMYGSGDVTLSKYLKFLRVLGFDLVIMEKETANGKQS